MLGFRMDGVDLSSPLDAGARRAIDAAFAEHAVLTFPNQFLDAFQLFAFLDPAVLVEQT